MTMSIAADAEHEGGDELYSPQPLTVPKAFSLIPTVPEAYRPLLDHFVKVTTTSISCHRGVQNELCSTIVPMAFEVPYLLTAVLTLAAAHRHSSSPIKEDGQLELLKGNCLKQLRSALRHFKFKDHDQILATILVLCMAEIVMPSSSNSSWRSHLHGAAALSSQNRSCVGSSHSSSSDLLRRKYQALQSIAMACGSRRYEGGIFTIASRDDTAIDDLAGYSTGLLPIFGDINDLDSLRMLSRSDFHCDQEPGPPHFDCNSPLDHQSHLLFDRIVALMAERDISRSSQSSSWLPEAVHHDLYRLDEAYHHMAILQVFRRGSLSVPLQLIDNSRQAILTCLSSMDYQSGPCPGVAALPPLFVAGSLCTSLGDRERVRSLLRSMWIRYGMGNVRQCRTMLELWWKRQDTAAGLDEALPVMVGDGESKEHRLDDLSAFTWSDGEHDILPY